ncbi:MAG: hypothetical protein JWN99_118 [Ilumatobacteraceae bacterium]|nr:hypothetical protein [Ilumatobacteraceae bacterium]
MTSMRAVWRVRVAVLAGMWLAVVGIMALLEMDPRPILIAGIAAAIGAALVLMLDVSDVARPVAWHVGHDPMGLQRGSDLRIGLLQRQMVHASHRHDNSMVHTALVGLVDDRLLTGHGIDRATHPDRAAAILGPELDRFVTTPASASRLSDARFMSMILTRIESL